MLKSLSHQLHRFAYSWRAVGPRTMLRHSLSWAGDAEARSVDSGFDARWGTDTNDDLTPREARIPADQRGCATMYLPTMDQDFEKILAALPWSEHLLRQSCFVDLGSGKGRVVFLAAMRVFRAVIGVELSPVLHQVAQQNLQIMQTAGALGSPVDFVLEDAASFEPPAGPLLFYMYHPFKSAIARAVVTRLAGSLERQPRPAAILYCHPTLQPPIDTDVFTGGDVFQLVAEGGRETRSFKIGWTVFTNNQWLARSCSATC